MGQPTQGDVHVNTPLTNISIAYLQNQSHFIADQVFPNIPVSKQSDLYYLYDRGMFNRDEMEVRGPSTESAGGDYTVSTASYTAKIYAFHKDIPDEVRANADSVLRPDFEATQFVMHKAMIKREKLWVAKYFADSIWTDDDDGVSGSPSSNEFLQWNDDASTPIEDIRSRKTALLQLTGQEANTLVLGQQVFDALIDHPDIVDRVKYGQTNGGPAIPNVAALQALFDIDRVLIMKATNNTAVEGAANVHAFIGGKKALLIHAAPNPGIMVPSGGYTFSWTGMVGGGSGQRIKKLRIDIKNTDRIEIDMAFDQKLVAADLGAFMDSAVA